MNTLYDIFTVNEFDKNTDSGELTSYEELPLEERYAFTDAIEALKYHSGITYNPSHTAKTRSFSCVLSITDFISDHKEINITNVYRIKVTNLAYPYHGEKFAYFYKMTADVDPDNLTDRALLCRKLFRFDSLIKSILNSDSLPVTIRSAEAAVRYESAVIERDRIDDKKINPMLTSYRTFYNTMKDGFIPLGTAKVFVEVNSLFDEIAKAPASWLIS